MSVDQLRLEIREVAHVDGEGLHRNEAVFRVLSGIIAEAGFLTNPQWAPLRLKHGRQNCAVDGYDIDDEDGILTLFTVIDCHGDLDLDQNWVSSTCTTKILEQAISGVIATIDAIAAGSDPQLEESDPARELVKSLRTDFTNRNHVQCCVLTTGEVTDKGASATTDKAIRTAVWDAERLLRMRENGREPVVADFSPVGGLPCLVSDAEAAAIADGEIGVLISKMPGQFLADLYNEYRMRLLERNVRAFLQFTGKVNKGIRETILHYSDRFLSYNNGISVTASRVELTKASDGIYHLIRAEDFQIVNGGQTTASIARCVRDDAADVSQIAVATKITVVPPELVEKLVPYISRYANSQNKVREDDFYANTPWHIELEKHSRALEAERDSLSEGRPIRWYYERVRGQYADEIAKHPTRAQKDAFKHRHPNRAKFTKTDLAKFLLGWEQEAHSVSLGAQKAFARLTAVLGATSTTADSSQLPSEEDFRRICDLGILHRHAEGICRELSIVGYKAQLIAYAVMVLSVKSDMRLPWRKIWMDQALPAEIDQSLRLAIQACDRIIRQTAGQRNVTEWTKRKECREAVLGAEITLPISITKEWDRFSIKDMARPKEEIAILRVFQKITSEQWIVLAAASKKAGKNPVWAGVAETMANRLLPSGRAPSEKQTNVLKKLLLAFAEHKVIRGLLNPDDVAVLNK